MYPIPPIPQLTMLIPTLMNLYEEQRKAKGRTVMSNEAEPLGTIVVSKRFVRCEKPASLKAVLN